MLLRTNRNIVSYLSRFTCLEKLVDNIFPDRYHITSKSFASLDNFKFTYGSDFREVILFHNTGYNPDIEEHKYNIIGIHNLVTYDYAWMSDVTFSDTDFGYPYKFIKILMYYLLGEPNKAFDLANPIWRYTRFYDILDSFYTHQSSVLNENNKNNKQLIVVYKKKVSDILFSDYDSWHIILNTGWMANFVHLTEKEFLDTILKEKYTIYREDDSDPNSEIECIADWNDVFNPRTWFRYGIPTIQTCVWDVKPSEILGIGTLSVNGYEPFFEKDESNTNKRILSEIEKYKLDQEINDTGEK